MIDGSMVVADLAHFPFHAALLRRPPASELAPAGEKCKILDHESFLCVVFVISLRVWVHSSLLFVAFSPLFAVMVDHASPFSASLKPEKSISF